MATHHAGPSLVTGQRALISATMLALALGALGCASAPLPADPVVEPVAQPEPAPRAASEQAYELCVEPDQQVEASMCEGGRSERVRHEPGDARRVGSGCGLQDAVVWAPDVC